MRLTQRTVDQRHAFLSCYSNQSCFICHHSVRPFSGRWASELLRILAAWVVALLTSELLVLVVAAASQLSEPLVAAAASQLPGWEALEA